MANELGELRRSAAASGFGPGAIIDFRAGNAPISALAAGLEEWDSNFPPAGMANQQAVHEERLQKKLGVAGFRLPPVRDPNSDRDNERSLAAVRFPHWLQCPVCDLIAHEENWADAPGKPGRWCADCTRRAPGKRTIYVVPVRFIMACENGHLDEFPWHFWVGHAEDCKNKRGPLRLRSERAGLAGIYLSCPKCNVSRSMDGVFNAETWSHGANCHGRRPWLATADEVCALKPRAMQRGASNLYFPVTESALSIPPWSDRLQEALGIYWDPIYNTEPHERAAQIRFLARANLQPILDELQLTPEALAAEIERRVQDRDSINTDDLRIEEYRQFTGGGAAPGLLDQEFEIRTRPVPQDLKPWFSRLVQAVRLREVRALRGFTRITPPGDLEAANVAAISVNPKLGWLPAVEVRGEGIFLEFDKDAVTLWENRTDVAERAAMLDARWRADWISRHGADSEIPKEITPRMILVHGFAHAIMRQLTLDCGYSSAALRERLYVRSGQGEMAGVLIYTATTDDDGTLGGLQRQGDPIRIGRTVIAAVQAQAWCSSDPLCIEGMLASDEGFSLAACHSCLLAPETSCEEFNRFLDRAVLVGTPSNADLGFFRKLLERTPS